MKTTPIERRWIDVTVPEINDFDLSDVTLTQFSIFNENMQQKYPDYVFGLRYFNDDEGYACLYARRLETDAELNRRKKASERMRQQWKHKKEKL